MWKQRIISVVITTILVLSTVSIITIDNAEGSNGTTLYVGGSGPYNFSKIQDAINYSNNGDTIYVYSGTYYENVIVNKTISLIGEDRNNTIIDGRQITDVINVSVNGVIISGLTLRNASQNNWKYAGINLQSNFNQIIGNKMLDNLSNGILLFYSEYNNITGNIITHSRWGINITYSNSNTILGNTITHNSYGIYFPTMIHDNSSDNIIKGNTITNNSQGISLFGSNHNNIITENTISDNNLGIYLKENPINNKIYHNNFINNKLQAYDYHATSFWDNGYPSGGNYWDDYTGPDNYQGPYQDTLGSDGIGDCPYRIYGGRNVDLYPLMHPVGEIGEKTIVKSHPLIDGDSIYAGTGFTLFIDVHPKEAIAGVQFDLSFDPTLFQAGTVYQGSLFYGSATYFNPGVVDNINGTIKDVYVVITTPGDNVTHSGEVAFVNFTSIANNGTCGFNLSNVVVGRPDGSPVPITIINSSVTIVPHNRWDVNQDDRVNILDLILIAQHWGETGSPCWVPADVNCDGVINILDMVLVGQHWTG